MNFKYLIAFALLCGSNLADAQNTFPANGAVGVGTTDPEAPLHVFVGPDSRPNGVVAASQSALRLTRYGTPNYSYNESAEFKITHGGPSVWGSRLDLYINGANNQSNIPDQHAMTWQYNGNVGIGTISPAQKLDVDGSVNIRQYAYFKNSGTVDYPGSFLHRIRAEDGYLHIDGDIGGSIYSPVISLYRSGNVGIGTAIPNEKLSVNGKIRAKEIKVEAANWPDYVFEKGYKVGTLEALESYIKANKHLPEIPSAKEVAADGVALGEMNKLLLKKIEELTLQLIEVNKKVDAQQIEIRQLSKKSN